MTKADLLDWALNHGCTSEPIPDDRVYALVLKRNDKRAIFNTVKMDSLATPHMICLVCTRLGIPVPNYGESAKDILNELGNMGY